MLAFWQVKRGDGEHDDRCEPSVRRGKRARVSKQARMFLDDEAEDEDEGGDGGDGGEGDSESSETQDW